MTKIDTSTAAIEALLKDVTPGPWDAALERGCHGVIAQSLPVGGANFVALVGNDQGTPEKEQSRFANARFIAASRELVPALLAERDALKAEVVKLRAERNHANDVTDAAVAEIERLKAQADAVWNEAIEAAVNEIDCGGCYGACLDPSNCRTDDVVAIRSLKRPIKGESHE